MKYQNIVTPCQKQVKKGLGEEAIFALLKETIYLQNRGIFVTCPPNYSMIIRQKLLSLKYVLNLG